MVADHKASAPVQQPGIYALATPPGRGAVAVLRLSGAGVRAAVESFAGGLPPPRVACLRTLIDRPDGGTIDRALVLWFPAPASYSGEDVAEFQLHGGRATVAAMVAALSAFGLRQAEPGEFTRRAFHNGKLDLVQAEALADLVEAETEAQRRQALRQMDGALGQAVEAWRQRLIRAMALIEAVLDFVDEDLPAGVIASAERDILVLRNDISNFLAGQGAGERLREGIRVAVLGPPNAGKSSLVNALAQRDAAIVSAVAGTTRDVIEVHLDLGGVPVIVADTAGLRETGDVIEAEGVRRAMRWADQADIRILVIGADDVPGAASAIVSKQVGDQLIVVGNKRDLAPLPKAWRGREVLPVSVRTGEGMGQLLDVLAERARSLGEPGEGAAITRARHRQILTEVLAALQRFAVGEELELRAEDLRMAARALGRMTGRIDVEDVLDALFRSFCIGK
jgi:tRNA modification GTPase